MAPPDARTDVTALLVRVESWRVLSREMGWVIGSNRLHDELKHQGMDVEAVAADVARRLTEQEAEIARLENRLRWFETAGGVAMATRVHQEIARAAAAEQALTAARRERDALNAAAVAIIGAYGPHSDYDQPYRGMWLALQYAIRSTAASPGPAAPAGEDR